MHNHDTGTSADRLYAYFGSDVNKVAYRAPTLVKNLVLEGSASEATATASAPTTWPPTTSWAR